jgi:hypothetical protein
MLALIWCLLVLLAHLAAGQFSCSQDTSDCATTSQKNTVFEGQLSAANTSFQVAFQGAGLVGGFRTDRTGHYCILWGPDGAGGDIVMNGQGSGDLDSGSPLRGVPPAGCRSGDASVRWDRADDLRTSWQFISVVVLALATMSVLGAGLLVSRSVATRVLATGLALTVATTVLPLVLWWPQL